MRFRGGTCPEKFQFYQIQNGRLVAIIDFKMRRSNIWKTIPDSYTIIKQNVWLHGGICSEKLKIDQIQYGRFVIIIDFIMQYHFLNDIRF